MKKLTSLIIGATMTALVVTVLITRERSTAHRLGKDIELLQTQRHQISDLAAENAHLSDLVGQAAHVKVSPSQPSEELLRLRGEVTQLHETQGELRKLRNDLERLSQENSRLRGLSLMEQYALSGVDTNGIPDVELGTARTDVLAELRRVRANLLRDEDDYIYAEVSPTEVASTASSQLTPRIELYFEAGRLTSRRDHWPSQQ
jgi:hypothetical protein